MSNMNELPEQQDGTTLLQVYRDWATDEKFRANFRADTKRVLVEKYGLKFADDVVVVVHETATIKEMHLVMPFVDETPTILDPEEINDGRGIVACSSNPPGSTCWNTPNCPQTWANPQGPC